MSRQNALQPCVNGHIAVSYRRFFWLHPVENTQRTVMQNDGILSKLNGPSVYVAGSQQKTVLINAMFDW